MFANATKFNRKSGGAQPRDLQFSGPFLEMFFDRADWRDLRFLSSPRAKPPTSIGFT
jgi:hypothetical protein